MNVAIIGGVSSSHAALEALIRSKVEITGVMGLDESQSQRVSDYCSLRALAAKANLPFESFVEVGEDRVEAFLRERAPDLLWVIGLSQLVPDRLIRIARHGGIGFHPTMLPRGRGRAPVAWTIIKGERAAANLFFLTDEPDAGDIIVQREVPVLPDDYSEDLIERTNRVLAEIVIELAPAIKSGKLPRTPQDHGKATYYPKRTPADGRIDWSDDTDAIYRLIRAAGRPYPGAFSHVGGRRVTIWRARPAAKDETDGVLSEILPGVILRTDNNNGVLVRTVDSGLWLTEVEVEGAGDIDPMNVLTVGARLE